MEKIYYGIETGGKSFEEFQKEELEREELLKIWRGLANQGGMTFEEFEELKETWTELNTKISFEDYVESKIAPHGRTSTGYPWYPNAPEYCKRRDLLLNPGDKLKPKNDDEIVSIVNSVIGKHELTNGAFFNVSSENIILKRNSYWEAIVVDNQLTYEILEWYLEKAGWKYHGITVIEPNGGEYFNYQKEGIDRYVEIDILSNKKDYFDSKGNSLRKYYGSGKRDFMMEPGWGVKGE
jgi:hypothetical protein